MGKENENIHQHIIDEDYRNSKRKQELKFEVTGKADLPAQLMQNHKNVVRKLQKMHPKFLIDSKPEEKRTNEDVSQPPDTDYDEQLDSCSTSELFSSFQEMKGEEDDLLDQKRSLLEKEHELRTVLIQQINKKRKTVQELESEVAILQGKCREIEQALGMPT